MIRVVIDTSVWIGIYLRGAITNPTQPYSAIFDALVDDELEPIFSRQTYNEVEHMLTRSRLAQRRIDVDDAKIFIESIYFEISDIVEITGKLHVSSDPKDDMFVETAIVGKAEYLVREDRDLREPAVHEILKENGVRAVFPKQFRKLIEQRRAPQS